MSQLADRILLWGRARIAPWAACCVLLVSGVCWASGGGEAVVANPIGGSGCSGLRDAVVLVIRHAEKPEAGRELTARGQQRAQAYADYFKNLTIDAKPLRPDYLVAAADSSGSERPRLTLEPLSKALGLNLDLRFKPKNPEELAEELRSKPLGKCILVCWHHGKIPDLVQALGADPLKLLPDGKWPDQEFAWILMLRYDSEGRLIPGQTKRLDGLRLASGP